MIKEIHMNNRIRILGIAPYEGMKTLMSSVKEEYPQIDLTLFVGDMEQGLNIARVNFHGDYDMVISRGGTAKMLKKNLALPVIEINISMYDILCTLKLANGLNGKIAMISFANITNSAQLLCSLLKYDINIYTVDSPEAVEPTLRKLQRENYQTILCDMISNTTAKRLGMNSILITSGIDSIRKAFDQAILLYQSKQYLRDENLFFRELINGQISQTIVFDQDGNLFLSTLNNPKPELLELLRRELSESRSEPERRITRNLQGMLYAIRMRHITTNSLSYTAFFFDAHKTPLSPNQMGIRFLTRTEAENALYNNIFSLTGSINDFRKDIDRLSQSASPVIIAGEDGTGKEALVSALYLHSRLQNNPLVSINCSLLNDKSWDFLLEHHNSPLADQDNTLYFASIDTLPSERQQQLLAALSEMEVCRRNRVIFSCVCQYGECMSTAGSMFLDKLCCLSLYLPPLRQMADRIPSLVTLFLSHLNLDIPRQIVGVEPEAVTLLQRFQWPHNYTQFRRVIRELAITATGQFITEEIVRQVLQKEHHVGVFGPCAENVAAPLNLNRTLNEINKDIVLRVLEETGGNKSAAAKRLGISRTTLWRFLQE